MAALADRISASIRRRVGEFRTAPLRKEVSSRIRKLDAHGMALVSNNCVAGILYKWAGLRKTSPTAGLYFSGPAYSRFLGDLSRNELHRWTNIRESDLVYKHDQLCWALAVSGGGELVFLHYSSPGDAIAKWERRIERLLGRTAVVVSSIQGGITPESLKEPLASLRFTFTVDGDPAPPADALVLDPLFLKPFVAYLDRVLDDTEGRTAAEILI